MQQKIVMCVELKSGKKEQNSGWEMKSRPDTSRL